MNYTDMEAKVGFSYLGFGVCMARCTNWLAHPQVREATNNEPWGASSTLMQEIANGTFN